MFLESEGADKKGSICKWSSSVSVIVSEIRWSFIPTIKWWFKLVFSYYCTLAFSWLHTHVLASNREIDFVCTFIPGLFHYVAITSPHRIMRSRRCTSISCFSGNEALWRCQRAILTYVVNEKVLRWFELATRAIPRFSGDTPTKAGKFSFESI
jgi:hypothetical protein